MKKALLLIITIYTFIRLVSLGCILMPWQINLPIIIFITSGMITIFGLYLFIKNFISPNKMLYYYVYLIVDSVVILFNLVYVRFATSIMVSLADTLWLRTFTRLSTNKREEYFSQATLPGRTDVVPTKGIRRRHLPVASLCTPDECRRQTSARYRRAARSGIHAGMRRIRAQRPQKHRPAPRLSGRIS